MTAQLYHYSNYPLRELVHTTLARSSHFAGRSLRIEVLDGEVILNGVVNTYYQKQLAQESVRAIDGVSRIRNELEVISR